jgi:pimeloyl-ACP methyl ester carboxylesterase
LPIQGAYDRGDREFLRTVWNSAIYTKNQPNAELYEEYLDDMLTQRNLAEVYHALNTFNISTIDNVTSPGNGLVNQINIPVLVLRGDRDYVVSAQMTEEILEDLGERATYIELKDCGHSPLVDDLGQLMEAMEGFLKKQEPKMGINS